MPQYIQLPDGRYFEMKEGETVADARQAAIEKYPEAFKSAEKPKPKRDTTGARAAAAAGFEELKGQTALTAAKLGFGDEQAAEQYFRERQQAARERFTPTEKGWTEAPLTKLAETFGGSIPYIAAPVAAGGIAALAATGVGAPAAAALVGAGAAGLANYGQFVGSNLGRQMEPEGTKLADTSLGAAAAAAAPQALLDTAAMALMPGVGKLFGSVGSKLTTQEARAIANQTVRQAVADYAKTAGGAMTREGVTETLQQVLERAQAGLSIGDPEARKEYIDSFIGGAALAGVGSPVGRGYERYKAREQAEEADIADRRKAREDALAQQEQERQQEEAYKQTPDYALKVNDQITQLEQQKIELQKQIRKITKDSPTEAVDKAFNREINAQLKENASQRNALAPEYNQLKKSGLLDRALEEQRVAGLSPMDYMLERTRTVPGQAPAGQAQDISTEDNWMVAPDRAAVLAQQAQEQQAAAQAEAPAKYAAQQLGIMVEQNYLPEEASALNVQEPAMFVPYLMADPQMAQQLVDNQVRIPGLNLRKNTQVLKALSEALASMPKPPEVQTATPAPAEAPAPVEGPAPRELSVMPTAVDQGDLFGQTGSGVINRPSYSSAEAIAQKLAELNEQYKAARLAQNARPDRRARPTTQMRQIVKEMNLLREMQQEISDEAQDTSRKDFGTETAELQTKLGSVPKLEAAQVQRNDTLRNMFDPEAGVSPQDVVAALVDEIQTVRPGLKPETITAIEQEALPALEQAAQGKMPNITDALDSLSAKWRGATASNPTFTRTAVPSTVSPQMLATQINRAFEKRNRDNTLTNFTPEEQSLLQKVIDNFGAIQNQPESLNLFSDWLNRKATSPQAAQNLLPDVQAQLAAIEEGKYDNSQQQELGAELMPEAVAPQAQTQVEGGKATFVSPQDVGPLQTTGAQLYAPQQKAEVFDSFEDFDRYLASDYLKAARAAQGMPRDTVSRMTQDIGALEQKLAAVGQRRAAIEQRKAQLANVRDSERRVGMQLVGDAEVKLGEVETALRKDLDALNTQYEKYQTQFDQANADSDRISQNIAANTAKFVKGHDNFVAAADEVAKAKAELLKARNKLGSIGEKLPGIVDARTKVLEALKRMRNPDAYAIETKIQTLTEQLKRALDANKQVIGGEADQGSGTVRRIYQQIAELRQQQRQVKPYVPSVAIVRFIDQDLALQQQQLAVERRLDNAARGMLRTGMAVQEETQALEQRRAASPELAAAKKEVETARALAKDATKGTEGEMVLADIEAEQEGAAAAGIRSQIEQKRGEITAAGEERTVSIGGKKWAMGPVPAERSAAEQRNKKEREDFQDRADRLAAIPGERIDFENRREMLAMVKATNDDKAQLDADIAENDEGISELSVRKKIAQDKLTEITKNLQGAERDVREKLGADAEKLKKYIADTDARIATLRTYGEQLQKTKAKRAAALEKAERVFSSDPEVAAAVTESIDKRIEKLKRNIEKQDELIKKTTDPETGAPVSEDTQKERKKRRREYLKELQSLVAQRSNRLGIRRTDAQTGEKISDIIAKKPEQALQTQLDEARARLKTLREDLGKLADMPAKKPKQALQTQIDEAKANVQQLKEALEKLVAARAKKPGQELQIQIDEAQARVAMLKESRAKLADLEKQRDAAEKAGNKNARAKLQTKINEVLLEISQLQPEQLGKVSQATRIQSSAPAKFRAGTAETKADTGTVKTPVVEKRDVKQPKAEQAVAEANAFVKRLNDAKTTEQLQAEFAAMAERTQQQILQAQLEETNRLIGQRDTIQREIAQLEAVVAQSPDRVQPATAARLNKLRKELPGVLDILGKRIADRAQLEAVVENGGMVVDLSGTEMTAKAPRSSLAESFDEDFDNDNTFEFSRGTPKTGGQTVEALERALDKIVGDKGIAGKRIVLLKSVADFFADIRFKYDYENANIPTDAKAFVNPKNGSVFMFADNIGKGEELGVLLHEVGVHLGFRNLFNAAQYGQLVSAVKKWAKLNDGSIESRIAKSAIARAEAAETTVDQYDDELLAYAVEEAVKAGVSASAMKNGGPVRNWLRMVLDVLRKALAKYGINPDKLTSGDLVNMAYGAAQLELRGTWHGTDATFTAFDSKFSGAGEGSYEQRFEGSTNLGKGPYVTPDKKYAEYYQHAVPFGKAANASGYGSKTYQDYRSMDSKFLGADKSELSLSEMQTLFESNLLTRYLQDVSAGGELDPTKNAAVKKYIPLLIERFSKGVENAEKTLDRKQRKGEDTASAQRELTTAKRQLRAAQALDAAKIVGLKTRPSEGNLYRTLDAIPLSRIFGVNEMHTLGERPKLDALMRKYASQSTKNTVDKINKWAGNSLFYTMRDKLGIDETVRLLKEAGIEAIEQNTEGKYTERAYIDQVPEIIGVNLEPVGPATGKGREGSGRLLFSRGAPSALESLADKTIGKPKTFREKLGKNIALEAEMQGVDMRAGLREALKAGAKGMGDDKLFTQGMYSVIKADQKLPLIYSVMSSGVPELYKDAKGLTGVRTTGRDSAADVFKAIAELPVDAKRRATVAQMYMVAQRAKNKGVSKLDIGALGITDAEIDAVLAEVDADAPLKKALENVRRQYNAYNKGLIDFLASTGAITKAEATRLNKDGDYVPFYRVNENGMAELVFGGNTMITIGDIRRQPYLNQLKGGETKLLPLDEAIPRNTFLLMDKALTNYAARNVAYALQEIGRSSKKMVIKKGDGRSGADVIRFNQEPDPNDASDTGKRHVIVDTSDTLAEGVPSELLVKSLEGAHLPLPEFLKLAGAASDLLRAGVTRMPMYIARQLFRDPMAAAFTGGLNYGPMRAVAKAGREFVRMSAGNSPTQAKLLEKGLIQSNIFSGDVDDIGDMARRIVQNREAPLYRKIFDAMDRTALRADAATRALVYDNAIANGLSEVEADMMTMESMNFYKRGLSPTVQYANRLIPFLNAQIQGLNVLYKAATGKMPFEESQRIKKKFFTNAAFLVSLGLVYAMAMQDDEYYKNARPRDRYTNFFLHLPGVDEPVKLPIPYEAGYFFSLAVAAVDGMVGEVRTKDQMTALRDMFLQSVPGYTSMGVPQIAKPAFEVFTNKNFLTGAPIESLRMKNLDTEQRYNTTTTELAKRISEAFPVLSPVQIEHLVRGYLGSMPLAIAAGANEMFAGADKGERPTGRMSDMPLIGTAFQKRIGGADSEAVARLAEDAMQARTTLSTMLKEGRREEAAEYKQENMARLGAATAAGQYRQLVGRINTEIRRVQERSDMTGDAKRARIDTLEDAKLQAARRFMEVVRRLEEREGA